MPKPITTQTRIADPGDPGVLIIAGSYRGILHRKSNRSHDESTRVIIARPKDSVH